MKEQIRTGNRKHRIQIDAEELWGMGVDTPDGIHCCYGGCTAGTLDLDCGCPDNKDVREKTIEFLKACGHYKDDLTPGQIYADAVKGYSMLVEQSGAQDIIKKISGFWAEYNNRKWKL